MVEIVILIFLIFVYINPINGFIPLSESEKKILNNLLFKNNVTMKEKTSVVTEIPKEDLNTLVDISTLSFFGEDKGDHMDINLDSIMKMGSGDKK